MLPYQTRVIEERNALDEKIAKLKAFLWDDERIKNVPRAELYWMRSQITHMDAYLHSLEARISLWNVA